MNTHLYTQDFEEAIKASGLDFEVKMKPVYDDDMREIDGFKRATRTDTNATFGVHSDSYVCESPRAFFEPLEELRKEANATYIGGGPLGGRGAIIFLQMTVGTFTIAGDEIRQHFMASTSYDGSFSNDYRDCEQRTVCLNTFRKARLESGNHSVSSKHTRGGFQKIIDWTKTMITLNEHREATIAEAEELLSRSFNQAQWESLCKQILGFKNDDDSTRAKNALEALIGRIQVPDLANVRLTAYGAIQAVADYEQHIASAQGDTQKQAETRFKRAFLNSPLLDKAYAILG